MSIISLFRKKEEKTMEIRKVCVLFNLPDHTSLLAAALFTAVVREYEGLDVDMYDIRDDVSHGYDQYVWIDAGQPEAYLAYYSQILKWDAGLKDHTGLAKLMRTASLTYESDHREEGLTALEKVLDALEERGHPSVVAPLRRFTTMNEAFMTLEADGKTIELYSRLLKTCYRYYQGEAIHLEDFILLAPASEEDIAVAMVTQQLVCKALASKVREAYVHGRYFHYINFTTPEIYGLFRRLKLAKKEFLHVAMGSYGVVTYSSLPVALEKTQYGENILQVGPKEIPVQTPGSILRMN